MADGSRMGAVTSEYRSLEHVAMDAAEYPAEILEGASSGLILFAAAFLGRNDAVHFAEAGVPNVTLVDVDEERLAEMRALYRDDSWRWLGGFDAWEVARAAREEGVKYDVVSVDTFTGDAEERSLASLNLWTAIAGRVVTVTASWDSGYRIPSGWRSSVLWRSARVYWLVLERERET